MNIETKTQSLSNSFIADSNNNKMVDFNSSKKEELVKVLEAIYKTQRYDYYEDNLIEFSNILNETNEQIIENDEWDYNCGGFAVGTFEWLMVNPLHPEDELINQVIDYENGQGNLTEKQYLEAKALIQEQNDEDAYNCAQELLEEYDYLRLIHSYDELKEDEYAFVFRVAADDFHFMRRFSNGKWAHKRGATQVEEIKEEDVFADEWEHRNTPYNSKIYMFACANQ